MSEKHVDQGPITTLVLDDQLQPWFESFLLDRKVQNMTAGTIHFYQTKLKLFASYCDSQVVDQVHQITPEFIRRYLQYLEQTGHNAGGIHAAFRVLKTFLKWWASETEPEGWKNPMNKVKAPRVPLEPIEPVEMDTVERLIAACSGKGYTAVRDKALLYFLLDTGARASEVCALNSEDIDPIGGSILIRQGKGRKPRMVFLGQKSRRALRAYLKAR